MAETHHFVDIFIRQVNTSRKGRMSVNHQDFPMIPVILGSGEKGTDRRKHFALYPQFFHLPRIARRQFGQGIGPVIHHADFHPLPDLFFQDIQYRIPHFPFFYDKVFQENKVLRFLQLYLQFRKLILSQRKILYRRIFIYRVTLPVQEIGSDADSSGMHCLKLFHHPFILLCKIPRFLLQSAQPAVQQRAVGLQLHKHIKEGSKYRKNQHRKNPGQLKGRIFLLVDDIQYQNSHKHLVQHIDVNRINILRQNRKQPEQHQQLEQQKRDQNRRPPKDNF